MDAPWTLTTESFLLMGTIVTVRVVTHPDDASASVRIDKALAAMDAVQQACTRFDPTSALRQLCRRPGEWVTVGPHLYHALRVALEVAAMTDGAFDPTIGARLERLGFDRHYLTGEAAPAEMPVAADVSYRDIALDADRLAVRLDRPMLLDLGAVAKGLAVDVAVQALTGTAGFAVDAGGDVYVSGVDPAGGTWQVGLEDPDRPGALLTAIAVPSGAVCTSGGYRRRSPIDGAQHHLLNAATGRSAQGLLSVTVVAPSAMLADAVATAAFVMGPDAGFRFIAELGLAGWGVTAAHGIVQTPQMAVWTGGMEP